MNLGQLIGELRARSEPDEERLKGEAAAPRVGQTHQGYGYRQRQVMEFLADGRAAELAEVAKALGIALAHAGALLRTMAIKGLISRHGQRHWYRYTKLGVALNP